MLILLFQGQFSAFVLVCKKAFSSMSMASIKQFGFRWAIIKPITPVPEPMSKTVPLGVLRPLHGKKG
jgi:hypothetical protein